MYHILAKEQIFLSTVFRFLMDLVLLVVFALNTIWPQLAFSESPPPLPANSGRLTIETVQKSIDEIEQSNEIDNETKASALALCREAMQDLIRTNTWLEKSQAFERYKKSAVTDIEKAKAELADNVRKSPSDISSNASLAQLEQALAEAKTVLDTSKKKLVTAANEPQRRANRRIELEKFLKEARRVASTLEIQQKEFSISKDEPIRLIDIARQIRLGAALELSRVEIEGYTNELASYRATTDLLPLQHDLAAREVTWAKAAVEDLKKRVSEARQRETKEQLDEARLKIMLSDNLLSDLAKENETLTIKRQTLIEKAKEKEEKLSRQREMLAKINEEFEGVRDKLKSVGRTKTILLFLKAQRVALPDAQPYRESLEAGHTETLKTQTEIIDLAEKRAYLASRMALLDISEDENPSEIDDRSLAELELLRTQKEYVDRLAREYGRYFNFLVELDTTEQELADTIDRYRDYIDEQVLWISSSPPIWDIANWREGLNLRRIFNADVLGSVPKALTRDLGKYPLLWTGLLLTLLLSLFARRRAKVALSYLGRQAEASGMQSFLPTAQAAACTILLLIPAAGLLALLAWRLSVSTGGPESVRAIGAGLWSTILIFVPINFFCEVCRPDGLAQCHFQWPVSGVNRIKTILFRIIAITFFPVLVATTLNSMQGVELRDTIGRLCFIVSMGIIACMMHFILRRKSDMFRAFLAEQPDGWISKAFFVGYVLMVLAPLFLLIIAALGYYLTAWYLASCWLKTVALTFTLLLLGAFSLRWVLVVRRRLAIKRAREEAQMIKVVTSEGDIQADPKSTSASNVGPDLATINKQTKRLIYISLGVAAAFGLWVIWNNVFPALGVLKYIDLWQVSGGSVLDMSRTITLADLAWAILIAGLTFFSARNIPGLLEMLFIHHLPIDKGLRFAITTVCRYVLVAIGVIWACNHVGLSWSKVQWILAAMSVGLGFGLQEIFANFVSGMVILFERPIRIGDIITIGDATGKVSKIQMRATTIIDWDKKELVVPNKEFVTGRLLNWTLTDTLNRIVIEVGVSYDSDPDRVREVLLKVAAEHPKVINLPKPICIFREFGTSALMFSLRVYLSNMKGRLDVVHEMNAGIYRALHEAGIKIAYPQLDLHVCSEPKKDENEVIRF